MTLHDDLDDDDLDGGLPPHLRRMLHDGADGPPLPAAVSDRLLGRVLVSVGAAAATTAAVTSVVSSTGATTATATATTSSAVVTTSAATAATGIGLGLKAAIVAGVVGVAAIVGVVVVGPPSSPIAAIEVPVAPAPPVVPGVAVAPVVPVPVAPVAPVVPVPAVPVVPVVPVEPVAAASTTVPPPTPRPVVVSPVVSPAAWELPLLEEARGALAAGRTDEALALVEDHQRRAPASALLEESTALRVITLSRAGRVEEAKVVASSFVQRWPKSLFGERVRQVLR